MSGQGDDPARRLAERHFEHPLISAFVDLDQSRFATANARSTEINSLLDRARRELRSVEVEHEDRVALEDDVERLDTYLNDELDPSGAHGVAVYCSRRADLFEPVHLPGQVELDVAIGTVPRLEPLLTAAERRRHCVALVSRREARLFISANGRELEEQRVKDDVHGQHRKGGWSEANYERSVEADVDAHLRRSAERLFRLWQDEGFDVLVLGGPHEIVTRFTGELHADLRPLLDETELSLDVGVASAADVEQALEPLRQQWRRRRQEDALRAIAEGRAAGGSVAVGLADTLAAVAQRQVQSLVLAPGFDAAGAVCLSCKLLYGAAEEVCPADGTPLAPLTSLRSAMVRAAVLQDADTIVLDELDERRAEIDAFQGVGALLRY